METAIVQCADTGPLAPDLRLSEEVVIAALRAAWDTRAVVR